MTIPAFPVPKGLTLFLAALAALAVPASATIQFSYCSSGCSSTGGSYSAWQSATGSNGLVFSGSPITFSAAGLSSGIYTDSSGAVFTGYSNSSTATTDSLALNGASLTQTTNGKYSGIEITLPSNTYAFALILSVASGFDNPFVELNDLNLMAANYGIAIPNSSSPQFFGFLSDTPITSIFIGNEENVSTKVQISSFELGAPVATPEISSLAFIGTGLLLFGLLRRRGPIQKPNRSLA